MTEGFFSSSSFNIKQLSSIAQCEKCGLYRDCQSPFMKVYGNGLRKILIVGEAPGKNEDQQGKPFVGKTGELLRKCSNEYSIDVDDDCWTTNSIICRSHDERGDNRPPTDSEIEFCRSNLFRVIEEKKPETIILLGASAVKSLIGWLWKEDVGVIGRWIGWQIPSHRFNAYICPMWHPSYIIRQERPNSVEELIFKKHLESACKLKGRPWQEIPDWKSRIKVLFNTDEVCEKIADFIEQGNPVAFDFETEGLKPDKDDLKIVSCAISDGGITIAYLWRGEAIEWTKKLLSSNVPKIGFSQKFEHRWTKAKLGIGVNNWVWDGMLAAHTLDNRPNINSLKFQAFVLLGVESYDDHIKPYLLSNGSNIKNRVMELDPTELLIYNAMDALLEFEVAKIQMSQMGGNNVRRRKN